MIGISLYTKFFDAEKLEVRGDFRTVASSYDTSLRDLDRFLSKSQLPSEIARQPIIKVCDFLFDGIAYTGVSYCGFYGCFTRGGKKLQWHRIITGEKSYLDNFSLAEIISQSQLTAMPNRYSRGDSDYIAPIELIKTGATFDAPRPSNADVQSALNGGIILDHDCTDATQFLTLCEEVRNVAIATSVSIACLSAYRDTVVSSEVKQRKYTILRY